MEEKSKAVVNAVVSNSHIPNDLAFSILSKFSIKSLKRFGCVCKSWSLLFENPHLMSMYCNNFTNTSLILKQDLPGKEYHSLLYLLSGERFENKVRLDFPIQDYPFNFYIVGSSVNGILCLLYGSKEVVFYNPTTREFKLLPPSPIESESPYRDHMPDYKGFGYDHVRDDYKLIRHIEFFEPDEEEIDRTGVPQDEPCELKYISFQPLWEIYSLKSDSWKKLDCEMPTDLFFSFNGGQLYTDGVCHWWGTNGKHRVSCLVSFDLSNEVSIRTPIPSYTRDGSFNFWKMRVHLAEINGSVALISNYEEKTTIEVSILGEVGVKESWTKILTIGPIPCVWNLIGVGKKGDIFFRKNDDELACFDLNTRMIVDLGLKGKKQSCQIVTYKENLESLISIGFEK